MNLILGILMSMAGTTPRVRSMCNKILESRKLYVWVRPIESTSDTQIFKRVSGCFLVHAKYLYVYPLPSVPIGTPLGMTLSVTRDRGGFERSFETLERFLAWCAIGIGKIAEVASCRAS